MLLNRGWKPWQKEIDLGHLFPTYNMTAFEPDRFDSISFCIACFLVSNTPFPYHKKGGMLLLGANLMGHGPSDRFCIPGMLRAYGWID